MPRVARGCGLFGVLGLLGLAWVAAAAAAEPPPSGSVTAPVTAAAEPAKPADGLGTLRWLVQDLPPHMTFQAGKAPSQPSELGHGEIDGFMRLLIERMPQYRHEFVEAGMPRFEMLVRHGQTLCSALHVRTPERLSWLYFTHLHSPLFSRQLHVIVRRDKLPLFERGDTPGQAQSLAEILQRPDLQGLLPRGRSFGPRIDALLQAAGAQAPKTLVTGRGTHLLAMLRAKRMDYTLEYPSVVDDYLASSAGAGAGASASAGLGADLVKLPLVEGRSTAVATAACSRTPEGRRQIEAIDQAVRQLAQDPQREAWMRAWRGPQLDEQDRQNLKRYMDERARGGPQIE